jgi:hypothetical protein
MELNEFLEKFLPDYSSNNDVARLDDLHKYFYDEMDESEAKEKGLYYSDVIECFGEFEKLTDKLFSEALQNFADRICEKQRENCEGVVTDRINDHETEPFRDGWYITSGDMLESEQPNIDEL